MLSFGNKKGLGARNITGAGNRTEKQKRTRIVFYWICMLWAVMGFTAQLVESVSIVI